MKFFKNSVGRPSNNTLKKRKLILFIVILLIIILLLFIINFIIGKSIFAYSKNASLKYKEPTFENVYSKQEQAIVKKEGKSTIVLGCPEGYVYYKNRKCINKKTPVALSLSFSIDVPNGILGQPLFKYDGKLAAKNLCTTKGYSNVESVKTNKITTSKSKTTYKIVATCIDVADKSKLKSVTETTIPYYKQGDYPSIPSACGGGNLNSKGCLPTSGAMIFSALTSKKITPTSMNDYASKLLGNCKNSCSITTKNNGYKTICSGSSYYVDFLKVYANNNGMEYQEGISSSMSSSVETYLKTGKCVGVAPLERYGCTGTASKAGICTNVGHFVVFAASQNVEYVTVKDPLYSEKSNVEVKTKDLINSTQSNVVVLFCNKNVLKSPSPDVSSKVK